MTKCLLILGARAMQVPAILAAKRMGLRVIVADPLPEAVGFKLADETCVCDLGDAGCCLSFARTRKIDGVLTLAADYPLPMVARICDELGLPGLTVRSATMATNKREMRQAFAAAGVPSPISFPVSTRDEAFAAFERIEGPAIFKPTLSHGGRGVTRVPTGAGVPQLEAAFERALKATRAEGVLVEEFIDGPEFSVEAVTFDGQTHVVAVTDKLTSGDPYYVEIGHSQPSRWPAKEVDSLIRTAQDGVRALGIDWAASHSEIRLGRNGPCVMEIGARLGGGYITTHLVPLSTGVDMVKAVISLALGARPNVYSTHSQGAAVRFITALPGTVRTVSGIEAVRQSHGVDAAEVYVAPGDKVMPLVDADGRVGHVVCVAEDAESAIGRAEEARDQIVVETEWAEPHGLDSRLVT